MLLGAASSAETFEARLQQLRKNMGEIAIYEPETKVLEINSPKNDPEFDRQGLHALAGLGRVNR